MAILAPAPPRAKIEHSGTAILIRIPAAPYAWAAALLLAVFLCFWLFVGAEAIGLTGDQEFLDGGKAFVAVWAVGWAYGAAAAGYQIAWLLLGTETIEVTPALFRYRRSVGGLGWWREYALPDVQRLRTPEKGLPGTNLEIGTTPRIFFDYGAKTVKFGFGVDFAEAHQLVTEICRHYPRLCKQEPQA